MKIKITMFIMSILFAMVLCGAASATDTGNNTTLNATNTTGLANTPWPESQNNNNQSGQSNYSDGPQTTNTIWSYKTTGTIGYSSPVIGPDGTIYIGATDSNFYAINSNGTLKWTYTTGGSIQGSAAISADGTIYFGCTDGKLYAIVDNGTNATLKWNYGTGSQIYKASPIIGADGTIYIGSYDQNLYAIKPDGTLKWNYTTGGTISSSATIGSDGTIYIGSGDGNLYALIDNGTNATQKWSYSTGSITAASIGTNGTIYVATSNGLYALTDNGTNATQKWIYNPGSIRDSPAISKNGTIYIGCNVTLYAVTDNGTSYTATSLPGRGAIYSSPIIGADGSIYLSRYNGIVQAYNPDGTQRWSYRFSMTSYNTGAIGANGTLYVVDDYFTSYGGLFAVKDLPVANFTVSTTNGNTSQAIQFTDNSTRYPATWAWDFGDGTNSNEENPKHTYTKPGTYTVTLTVTNTAGNSTQTKDITIIDTTAPTVNTTLPSGIYNTQTVTLNATDNNDSNPVIYYSLNNGDTWSNATNSVTLYLDEGKITILFYAEDNVGNKSPVYTQTYTIDTTAPTASVNIKCGLYNTNVELSMSENGTIYYTLNGSTPTTSSTKYTGPINITSTTTLKYIAVDTAGNTSPVYSETYTIDKKAPTATASVKSGLYNTNKTVTLSMSENGTIYYTLNGSTPTTSSKKYTGPLTINSTTTLKYIAVDAAGNTSPVYTKTYAIDKTAPKVSSTSPKVSATGVSKTKVISIKFNENILKSVNWSKVYMKNLTTGKLVSINKWIKGNTLYIQMTHKRYPHNWYKIYIPKSAVKDNAGNKLTSANKLTFKT